MTSNLQPIKMLIAALPQKDRLQLLNDLLGQSSSRFNDSTPGTDRYLRPREAALYIGLSKKTLERYRKAGLLRTHKLNQRVVRYRASDLDRLFAGQSPKVISHEPAA